MAIVPIRINGREYHVACDDGQEEHLRVLSFDLDERISQLSYQMGGNPGEVMSLLLAGLMLVDEAIENKKEIENLIRKNSANPDNSADAQKLASMEQAMIETLNEVASRIERMI